LVYHSASPGMARARENFLFCRVFRTRICCVLNGCGEKFLAAESSERESGNSLRVTLVFIEFADHCA
jgi:hypothetical protein